MLSSVLVMVAAATAAQTSDTTRASREAFTACLRTYVNHSIEESVALDAFRTAYPQQCTAQQQAFRDAIVRRETAGRASQADAQELADLEIEDARLNFSERFEMSIPAEPQQQQAQAQPPAQPEQATPPPEQAQAQQPAQPAQPQ